MAKNPPPIFQGGSLDIDQALHEFDRSASDADHTAWSKRWGRALVERVLGGSVGAIPHPDIYRVDGQRKANR